MAPSTPPPPASCELAALTIASTAIFVMSPFKSCSCDNPTRKTNSGISLKARPKGFEQIRRPFFRRKRAHRSNADNLAAELAEPGADFNLESVEQSLSKLSFVYTGRRINRIQMPDAIF